MTIETPFQWKCHPKSEAILLDVLSRCARENSFIAQLQKDLLAQTSTRLFDWLDHLIINDTTLLKELESDGYVSESVMPTYRILRHPGAQLPRVVVREDSSAEGVAIVVDSIADFLMVRGMSRTIEGTALSNYRRCFINAESEIEFWVVERRATNTMEPSKTDERAIQNYILASELWKTRPRAISDEDSAMKNAISLGEKIIQLVGQDLAAWIVLEVERKYWQTRNTAGQLQKNRQDRLGMGWANHDHHTFRSSRKHFHQLLKFFEMLGFYCRERFYAGKEAGWGAQVMEHPGTRLVLFLDVDLLPEELQVDFRYEPLKELDRLHTVGLWCALHGDSILKAGMHHLEAQFMFDELKKDLSDVGVNMMDPFSNFPFLKQAFTKGEMWPVDNAKIDLLLQKKLITQEQAEKFRTKGAVGSHMENLQRREGYKGFNQQNVSSIIQKTDPRNINF